MVPDHEWLAHALSRVRDRLTRRLRVQAHARLTGRKLTWWQAFGCTSDPTKDP